MMTPLLNAKSGTTKMPNVHSRSLTMFMMFASLTLLTVSAAKAQTVSPVTPLDAVSSPAAFAEIAVTTPLDLGNADVGVSTPADAGLPEDPSAGMVVPADAQVQNNGTPASATTAGPVAPIYTKYIPAGWAAQRITAKDKVIIGLRDLYSPLNFAAIIITAGYEQALNGQPNYGVDRGAFGERLGAAGIRETTQGFFTDSVFAPILHEDPRYYVEGAQYGFFHRTIYAATRPLITRTDSGHNTVNGALLLGYAASSGLTYAYYPQINRNFKDTAYTFGGAIGGAALGYFVSEFSTDVLVMLHLKKAQ